MSKAIVEAVPFPDNVDYDVQSIPVPGTKRPGQTGASHISICKHFVNLDVFHHSPLSEWSVPSRQE